MIRPLVEPGRETSGKACCLAEPTKPPIELPWIASPSPIGRMAKPEQWQSYLGWHLRCPSHDLQNNIWKKNKSSTSDWAGNSFLKFVLRIKQYLIGKTHRLLHLWRKSSVQHFWFRLQANTFPLFLLSEEQENALEQWAVLIDVWIRSVIKRADFTESPWLCFPKALSIKPQGSLLFSWKFLQFKVLALEFCSVVCLFFWLLSICALHIFLTVWVYTVKENWHSSVMNCQ